MNDSPDPSRAARSSRAAGGGTGVERLPADLAHHVEVTIAHRTIVAVPDRLGDRDADGMERVDDPVLAEHVVRLGEQVALRGPADHELLRRSTSSS